MRVVANRTETPTTRILRLALDDQPFDYKSGQAAWIGVDPAGELTPYSIASAPEETARTGLLEFLVKVDGSTRFGTQVTGLRRGAAVHVRGPAGSFTFPDRPAERHFLFVAGGTGIAPLRSMIRHIVDARVGGSIALLYSARTPQEFAYGRELRAMAKAGTLRLIQTVTGAVSRWRDARGRASAELIRRLLPDAETLCFVCGPPGLVAVVTDTLKQDGIAPERIRRESW